MRNKPSTEEEKHKENKRDEIPSTKLQPDKLRDSGFFEKLFGEANKMDEKEKKGGRMEIFFRGGGISHILLLQRSAVHYKLVAISAVLMGIVFRLPLHLTVERNENDPPVMRG